MTLTINTNKTSDTQNVIVNKKAVISHQSQKIITALAIAALAILVISLSIACPIAGIVLLGVGLCTAFPVIKVLR